MTHHITTPQKEQQKHIWPKKLHVEFKRVQNIQPNKERKKNQKDQNKTASANKESTPAIFCQNASKARKEEDEKKIHIYKNVQRKIRCPLAVCSIWRPPQAKSSRKKEIEKKGRRQRIM